MSQTGLISPRLVAGRRRHLMAIRASLAGLSLSLIWVAAQASLAAEPASKPLEYRRVFVPADEPNDWPKHNVTYWPVAREEFEKLVEAANAEPRLAEAGAARITRASYVASFQPPDLLVGEARFQLPHGGQKTALVTLDPFGLSLTAAKWTETGEATIGVQPGGKLAVLVERPGTLICKWSLRGRRDGAGALVFPLELPAAAVAELELRLSDAFRPVLDEAVELGRVQDRPTGPWRFQLLGRSRAELRLEAAENRARPRGLVLLQETSSYGLLPGGIDLTAHLKLDVNREPLRRLDVDLDPLLRVVSVQYAGAEVPWSVVRDAAQDEKRLNIDFTEPLLGPGRVVTVTALAPLRIDAPVMLPRLHVRDVAWQEGSMSVSARAPLALDALVPRGCRQTKVAQLTGDPSGESVDLQLFSPGASVGLQVSRRPARGQIASGATLRFASDSVRAELRGHFEATEGEWFTIQAVIAEGWEIDAVTADRAEALESWSVNRSARPAVLVLQLAESVAVNRPLDLTIAGHRGMPADARLAGRALEMLHFRNFIDARRMLVLETAASRNVRLAGPDRPRLIPRASLAPAERALLPSADSDAILEINPDRTNWQATIERRAPRFSADIRVSAEVGKRDYRESYAIHCRPDGSRVDGMLLAFSQARTADFEFSGDESLGAIAAERLASADQAAHGLPPEAEVWLLRWGQPAGEPFELRASRTTPSAARLIPALASAPHAKEQHGAVEIQFKAAPLVVEADERLEPIAPQAQASGDNLLGRSAFRYDPVELNGMAPPAVVLRAPADATQPALAQVWRLKLHSLYRPSGESDHVAVFDIENRGAEECMLSLPHGAELARARLNGVAVDRRPSGLNLTIPLAETEAFPVIVVEYVLREGPMAALARRQAPWPGIDLPVAAREWKVSCGSHYQSIDWSGKVSTWAARLLGPLARQADGPPFNPLSQADWRRAANRLHQERGAPAPAKRLLNAIGHAIADAGATVVPLGRLLATVQSEESAPALRLVVDERALAALSIDAAAPIRGYIAPGALDDNSAVALATQRLASLGLAVMLDGERLVLTSRSAAIEHSDDPVTAAVFVARAATTDADAKLAAASQPLVSLAAWLRSPEAAWAAEAAECGRQWNCVWTAYEIESGDNRSWRVVLVHRDVVVAASCALAALVFCLGAKLSRRRFVWLTAGIGLAALAATWAPAALLPLARALLFGSLGAAVWQRVRPRLRRSPSKTRPALATMPAVLSSAVPVLLLWLAAGVAHGDETTQAPLPRAPAAVHRVFVPVDSDNKPSARYYVPTDFLDELRRRASQAGNEPRGWLMTSANYECQLSREMLESPIAVTSFTASFKLEVLSPYVRLRLPFVKRQVELAPDGARLDGQPIKMAWSEKGDELSCDVIEPGIYELQLSLVPVLGGAAEMRELSLSIPKVALATVEVSLPAEGLAVEVPGIVGEQRVLESGRTLSADLGPRDTLTLRWPQRAAAPQAEVEELLWLTVRPGSVVLDVALKLNVAGGPLSEVRFTADRRLRLVPGAITAKELPTPTELATFDATQTIELDLEQPLLGQDTIRLSFLMTGASGVGNLRLPLFHTENARVVRRWLAVTVDAELEYETRDAERFEALPSADFAAQWGGGPLGDALTYRLPEEETTWTLATRSREPQTNVKESLSLSFQRTHALVLYEAQLVTSQGYVFQHRLSVPPEIEIEDIALEEDGANRVSHWARNDRDLVSVFLNRRLSGAQRLTLTGRMPVRASGRVALPRIGFESDNADIAIERAKVDSRLLRLYRQPTVRIALEGAVGLSPLSDPLPELFDRRLGRLVVAQSAAADYSGNVSVAANDCQVRDLEQLTSLRYINQQWQAEISFRFKADGGILDFVQLEVPPAWSANMEIVAPVATAEIARLPGENRNEFIVRPLVAFSGDCQLKLRTTVRFQPGENVLAPDIVAADLPASERYWSLPKQVGIEAVNWDVERLSQASLPQRWGNVPAESSFVFRALAEGPRAALSPVKTSTELARVRLCDVRLSLSGELLSGVAAFDLFPGGRASCPLELAGGWRLIAVSVGGTNVVPVAQGAGKWDVPLHSNRLPQRVEVVFIREKTSSGDSLRWPIAWLDEWPVEETLLAVCTPETYRARIRATGASQASSQAVRLASAVELTELPAESLATTEPEELAAWYGDWARRLVFYRREAPHASAGPNGTIDDLWLKNARRLGVEPVLRQIVQQPLRARQSLEVWRQLHAATPAAYYHWTGAAGPEEIRLVRHWRGWLYRLTASLWVVAFFAVALTARRFAVGDMLDRWPQLALVGLGLLWWLFCVPSAAGWLAVAAGLILSIRSLWRPLSQYRQHVAPYSDVFMRILILTSALAFTARSAAAEPAKKIDFSHDIAPLVKAHCGKCHTGEKREGSFSLNTREELLKSQSVVPGDSAQSSLYRRLITDDAEERMPAKAERLPPETLALFRAWIDGGLAWEAGFTFSGERYLPPLRPRPVVLPPARDGAEHPIDRLVLAYFDRHQVTPPPPADDATFARRASLDVIGLLPAPNELADLAADASADKRERFVRRLLDNRRAYADHWLTFWNDLLRNDYRGTGYIDGGRKQITKWLYQSLVDNKPYDQFVRELIEPGAESEGFIRGIQWRGRVNASQTVEIQFSQNISQVFFGINMKCASCHDSFIDTWKLDDAYALAAFAAEHPLEIHRCDKATGRLAQPRFLWPELGAIDPSLDRAGRLKQLAGLIARPENGRFARTIVNRLWHRLLGRGLVHPVDVMANRPWSEDLLEYLAGYLVERRYDLKQLMEHILTSRTYQAQCAVAPSAASGDDYVFRGPEVKRMSAEQYIDAIWQITGGSPGKPIAPAVLPDFASHVPDKQKFVRASLLFCDELMRSLGRPNREQVVTVRGDVLTTLQALDLSNGPVMAQTLAAGAARLLRTATAAGAEELIRGLYSEALSRPPSAAEQATAAELLGSPPSQEGLADLLWAVFMLPEFQLIR